MLNKILTPLFVIFFLLNSGAFANPLDYFPADAKNSNEKLRVFCGRDGVECEEHRVVKDLSITTLFAKAKDSKKILVLVSGTHGVETYAGAAIQFQFLHKHLNRYLEKDISVLIVHGLNPWGFLHHRRVTEHNQDLNRTFPSKDDSAVSANLGYQKLKTILQPEDLNERSGLEYARFAAKILWKIVTFQSSAKEINQAVAGGQREEPKGLFYGGGDTPPQVLWLQTFLDQNLKGYDEAVMMDLHTGLGESGMLHLMPSDDPTVQAAALRDRLFAIPKEQGSYVFTTKEAKGFYKVAGDFLDFAEERGTTDPTTGQPTDLKVAALTMEFGTRGTSVPAQLDSLFTLVVENQSYHTGWLPNRKALAQEQLLEHFAPRDPQWRTMILQRANQVFEQIHERF